MKEQNPKKGIEAWLQNLLACIPLIAWLFGVFGAVLIEYFLGDLISYYLGLPKIPVLSAFSPCSKNPCLSQEPSAT